MGLSPHLVHLAALDPDDPLAVGIDEESVGALDLILDVLRAAVLPTVLVDGAAAIILIEDGLDDRR